ncbi:MAG TPA: glycosyltransferase family 39 protein [Chloroflexota bacterium]|nr:glycosyltransferase family 39 protein [Chloroflexota bacterium]
MPAAQAPIPPSPANRRRAWWGLLLVLVLDTAVLIFLIHHILAFQQFPFDADEANHALPAQQMALALGAGDLGSFGRIFAAQNFYPPGVTWLKALVFLLWGGTAVTARLFSAISLFLVAPVLYAICLEIDQRYGWLSGLIAATLTLTMHSALINGALVMLEMPGLLVSILALWAYLRVLKRPSPARLLLTSLLLTLTILTKYTYGAVTLTAVALTELTLAASTFRHASRITHHASHVTHHTSRITHHASRRWLYLFGPLILALLLWLARPGNLSGAVDYAQPLAGNAAWLSWRGLAYYPLSLAQHETPAPLFALVNLAGLIWAFANWRNPGIRLLLLYFLAGMALIMFINHPFNPRFIATFVPTLHLLTAVMLTHTLHLTRRHWPQAPTWQRAAILLLAGLLLLAAGQSVRTLPDRFRQFSDTLTVEIETHPALNDLAGWLQSKIPPDARFFLVNPWDQFSAAALTWRLATTSQATWTIPSAVLSPATPDNLARFRHQLAESQAAYVVVLEGGPWGAPAWPDYTAVIENGFDETTRRQFIIPFYTQDEWGQANGRQELHIQAIIYEREN